MTPEEAKCALEDELYAEPTPVVPMVTVTRKAWEGGVGALREVEELREAMVRAAALVRGRRYAGALRVLEMLEALDHRLSQW